MKVTIDLTLRPTLTSSLFNGRPLAPRTQSTFIARLLGGVAISRGVNRLHLVDINPSGPGRTVHRVVGSNRIKTVFGAMAHRSVHTVRSRIVRLDHLGVPLFFTCSILRNRHAIFPVDLNLTSSFGLSTIGAIKHISTCRTTSSNLGVA